MAKPGKIEAFPFLSRSEFRSACVSFLDSFERCGREKGDWQSVELRQNVCRMYFECNARLLTLRKGSHQLIRIKRILQESNEGKRSIGDGQHNSTTGEFDESDDVLALVCGSMQQSEILISEGSIAPPSASLPCGNG